jgi:hypothetical protein
MGEFVLQSIVQRPFPHVVVDDYLEPDLYRALALSFPECPANTGPTGYSFFWGDPEYDQLISSNEAWRTLFYFVHSQAFVRYAVTQFRTVFEEECRFDLTRATYVPYQESRTDKERSGIAMVEHAPDELWVRLDIVQGRMGYDRRRHLDHRRRAATMLIYFCDNDEDRRAGGELILHGVQHEENRIVRPRHNRMAMFPCFNGSQHSVPAVTAQLRHRNFVQITVSSSVDLWKPMRRSSYARAVDRLSSLFSNVR